MKIPQTFNSILELDITAKADLYRSIEICKPILEDNKLFFFEEYTDHGIAHIEKVLESCSRIISDESFEFISSEEISILIQAVLLHDIGMHIEFTFFKYLLNGINDYLLGESLFSKSWNELWKEYLLEIKRFDTKQKYNIYGNPFLQITEPDLDNKDNLTGFEKKTIGEFIRRNHARLANEIALSGFIDNNGNTISIFSPETKKIKKEIVGILSRSHGINIRDTFEYLRKIGSESWRNPNNVNIVFLMVVLRIADYLQIDISRVNNILIKIKSFNSPISQLEHKSHLSVESVNLNQLDSEKIFVLCRPDNSIMYVKLQQLIEDIQRELDVSWSVLGEVYGFIPLKKPKIRFRRISSNLTDISFINSLQFIPQKVKFTVSDELSKLLIAPLYGNEPTYGIRELIQNAVDACNERQVIEAKNNKFDYVAEIQVSILQAKNNKSVLEIVDNGKGMSKIEILNYYLSVGNSYRSSTNWKREFISKDGKTIVTRNGKFGIGVLASFLLGEEIKVKTVNIYDKAAYEFSTKIDDETIEILKYKADDFIGTKISIIISDDILIKIFNSKFLDERIIAWTDWYSFSYPAIRFFIDGDEVITQNKIQQNELNYFSTKDFTKIGWSYNLFSKQRSKTERNSMFVCNGIVINKYLNKAKKTFFYDFGSIYEGNVIKIKPSIFLTDNEGSFPIKLDRNDIDCNHYPFEVELYTEVCKQFCILLLKLIVNLDKETHYKFCNHKFKLLYCEDGFILNFDYFIEKIKDKYSLLNIVTPFAYLPNELLQLKNCFFNINYNFSQYKTNMILISKIFKKEEKSKYLHDNNFVNENNDNVFIENENYKILNRNDKFSKSLKQNEGFQNKDIFTNIAKLNPIIFENISRIEESEFSIFNKTGGKILNSILQKYIGDNVIIPYDINKRKIIYNLAFEELGDYVL